jgi:regulator of protease activity HflC (stomatin/prohibitin superfamily)
MADGDEPAENGPGAGAGEPGHGSGDGKETIDEIVARLKKETGMSEDGDTGPGETGPADDSPAAKGGKGRSRKKAQDPDEPEMKPASGPKRSPGGAGRKPGTPTGDRGRRTPISVEDITKREGGRIFMNGEGRRARVVGLMIGLVVIILSVLGVTLDMLEVIPAGHKGVIVTSPGGPSDEEINEGYQFSTRYIWADVEVVEYRTQTVHFIGHDYADDEKGSVQIITNDSMPIFLDLSVIYHIQEDRVADLIIENGRDYQHRIIYPYVRSIARDVASRYQALDIIGDKRSAVESTIQQNIISKMAEKYIVVEGVAMRDVRIPANLESAIINKKVAEQNVLTEQYNLIARQYIANQTIVNAQANATAYIVEQTGFANGTVVRAVGQAEAMERIIVALNSSSYDNRTKDYLTWAYIQALTDPNTKVKFIVVPANGAPVILDVSGTGQ